MKTSHKCSVPGCGVYVPARDLMCRRHWMLVPYAHRAQVARARSGHAAGEVSLAERVAVEARATATVAPPPPPPGPPPANTTYRGVRITYGGRLVASAIMRNGDEFRADASRYLRDCSEDFEWGYGGAGPAQLALALVLDATGDPATALRCYQWFKWATVAHWGASWFITAGAIRQWVAQCDREQPEHDQADDDAADVPAIAAEGGVA